MTTSRDRRLAALRTELRDTGELLTQVPDHQLDFVEFYLRQLREKIKSQFPRQNRTNSQSRGISMLLQSATRSSYSRP